jgi:hypothetical protein
MAKQQPNVAKESGSRLRNDDPQYRDDNRDFYYGPKNVNGPYERYRARPNGPSTEPYIPGFSTQSNVDKWSERASKNSYPSNPSVAPGTGNKSRGR